MTKAARPQPNGNRIEDLIELIDTMIDVIHEENVALSIGIPASQSRHTEQKIVLADQFERWVKDVGMYRTLMQESERALQHKVIERIGDLKVAMDQNMVQLRAAIEASQRRIEAVMSAIREQIADKSPYNAGGRVNGHAASSYGTSIRA